MSKSKIKVMLIAFFDQKGMVHYEFVAKSETVNQHFYQQLLICLHNQVRCSRWEFRVTSHGFSKAISVRQLLVKKQITALDHPPFSPDLVPCDFWLFPRLKAVMKETHFLSLEKIKASMRELKRLKEEGFTKCFCGWQDRMQKCIDLEKYFEGDNSQIIKICCIKTSIKTVWFLFCHISYTRGG